MYKVGLLTDQKEVYENFQDIFCSHSLELTDLSIQEYFAGDQEHDFYIIKESATITISDICKWIVEIRKYSQAFIWILSEEENSQYGTVYLRVGADGIYRNTIDCEELCIFISNLLMKMESSCWAGATIKGAYKTILKNGNYSLNRDTRSFSVDKNRSIKLTRLQLLLMEKLIENHGETVSYGDLCVHIWGERISNLSYDRKLKALVACVRLSLKSISHDGIIVNNRTIGTI